MGTKSGIFQIDDFSGGLITKGSIIKLKPNQTPKCVNVWANMFGTLHRRYGYAKINTVSQAATCLGLFTFIKSSASKFLMGKWGAKLYKMDNGATVWDGAWDEITLGSTLTSTSLMSWDVFKKAGIGTLIFTSDSGTDLMQYWTGTGDTKIVAGAPKCKQLKVWMNHVWAINCEAFYVLNEGATPWTTTNAIQESLSIFTCETPFNEQVLANVTNATDATDYKEGSYAAKILILNDTFATGLCGTKAITSASFVDYDYITFWIKSSINLTAGHLHFQMDDTASCASPLEDIALPALTANTWQQVQLTIATPAALTAIISIGFYVQNDQNQAFNIWVDDIRATNRQYMSNSVDHGDKVVGEYSASFCATSATFATGFMAINTLAAVMDISSYTKVDLWVKTSHDMAAGDLKLILDDTVDCSNATPSETLDIPAVTASGGWTYCTISLANAATDTAIRSIGIKQTVNHGAIYTVHVNNIRATFSEPDRLTRSAVLYYDDWNGADSGWDDLFTAQDIGLTAIQDLRGSLFIFKRKSVHKITYAGGRPLITIQQIKASIGTLSPKTVLPVDIPAMGEFLFFLGSDRQLYTFAGNESQPISEPIQTSNGEGVVYMNNINCTTGIDAALAMCHAINIPDFHWYVLFVPIGTSATAPTHAIIYDYLAKAFWCFDTQPFTASWFGDNGLGNDIAITGGTNYSWTWNSGNSDDGTAIATSWESYKMAPSKQGRPMLKKCRYVEGNSKINGTWPLLFSFRNDWASSYTTTQTVTQNVNEWTRDVSQVDNIIQVRISDTGALVGSAYPDPYEIYSLDFVGEDLTIGR